MRTLVQAKGWVKVHEMGSARSGTARFARAALSHGDPTQRHATGTFPALAIGGAPYLDLPVVAGGFGAAAAAGDAPPRPFQPAGQMARRLAARAT